MDLTKIIESLSRAVPDAQLAPLGSGEQQALRVHREHLLDVCRALRDLPELRFSLLSDVTAVDWWPDEPRFEVVYLLASLEHKTRLRLKMALNGDEAYAPTVSTIWPGADWLEREVWDLFGIVFDGHPDLRRLLMPDDWDGHPLRKDYPVQIEKAVQTEQSLGVTEEEFRARIEADRVVRIPKE
jgi:NADH-quinone oxidoreductase subunit C